MDLTLSEFVTMVLTGSAALVLAAALLARVLRRRAERRGARQRVVCRLCLHAFEVQDGPKFTDCPGCGVKNEVGR